MAAEALRSGIPRLMKAGHTHMRGVDAVLFKNIEAAQSLTKITKTSFGPHGMNKMVINHLERLFVTSDAWTIMREMEVEHPAAKIIVEAADMQEKEIGDGSNLVVILAGELLANAQELVTMGIHTTDVVKGYDLALNKVLEVLPTLVIEKFSSEQLKSAAVLRKVVKSSVASKQYGLEDFLSGLVADACSKVMPANPVNFSVDDVRLIKIPGSRATDSHVVNGMLFPGSASGVCHKVSKAKIAMFSGSIDVSSTETKGTVLIHTAKELVDYNQGEEKWIADVVESWHKLGVTCVVSGSTVSEMAQHYLDKYNIFTLVLQSKFGLRRLARAVGARILPQLTGVTSEECGFSNTVQVKEVGGKKVVQFAQADADTRVTTIVIRGSTQNLADDIERALEDGINVVKALGKDSRILPGAAAPEIELARQLRKYAEEISGTEQYAVKEFARALEVIPRALAENTGFGLSQNDVVPALSSAHESDAPNAACIGLDTNEMVPADMTKQNIFDLFLSKLNAIKLATTAAKTVLRVDQIIMAKKAGGPKVPQNRGHWDAD